MIGDASVGGADSSALVAPPDDCRFPMVNNILVLIHTKSCHTLGAGPLEAWMSEESWDQGNLLCPAYNLW